MSVSYLLYSQNKLPQSNCFSVNVVLNAIKVNCYTLEFNKLLWSCWKSVCHRFLLVAVLFPSGFSFFLNWRTIVRSLRNGQRFADFYRLGTFPTLLIVDKRGRSIVNRNQVSCKCHKRGIYYFIIDIYCRLVLYQFTYVGYVFGIVYDPFTCVQLVATSSLLPSLSLLTYSYITRN